MNREITAYRTTRPAPLEARVLAPARYRAVFGLRTAAVAALGAWMVSISAGTELGLVPAVILASYLITLAWIDQRAMDEQRRVLARVQGPTGKSHRPLLSSGGH